MRVIKWGKGSLFVYVFKKYRFVGFKIQVVFPEVGMSESGAKRKRKRMSNTRGTSFSWLLSNNRLEEVCGTLTKGTFSSRLLISNQDKGCTPSVAHSLPLPLPLGFCSTCHICSMRMYVVICSMCMYVVICKIDHCIRIHWCIPMGQWSLGRVTHVTSTDVGSKVI